MTLVRNCIREPRMNTNKHESGTHEARNGTYLASRSGGLQTAEPKTTAVCKPPLTWYYLAGSPSNRCQVGVNKLSGKSAGNWRLIDCTSAASGTSLRLRSTITRQLVPSFCKQKLKAMSGKYWVST